MRLLAPSLLFLAAIAGAGPAMGQASTSNRDYVEDVRAKLAQEQQHLSGQNYRKEGAEIIEPLGRDKTKRVIAQFEAGRTYAIVAACDKDCSHVQISLHDASGALLVSSPEKEAVVIVSGAPVATGSYAAEVAVPGCKEKTCHVGIVVMRLEPNPVAAPVPAPSGVPRNEKELSEALQRALKELGCYLGDIDGEWGPQSKEALERFAAKARITVDIDDPSEDALAQVLRRGDQPCASLNATRGITDGRWTGDWGGRSSATILISNGKVLRYRFRGREVPITRATGSGNTITFGSDTYTVRVTFHSDRNASAHYRHHTNGNTSTADLTRQWPR
jgi:peptidoglycan hydrolase-like protein with peptidoglycan-binding domain